MLNFIHNRRMRKWQQVDAATYADLYKKLGGSVLTHPTTINAMSMVADIDVQYYLLEQEGEPVAAIPVWQKWLAGHKVALKKSGKKGVVDMGNAEVILPISTNTTIALPVKAEQIADIHKDNISNLKLSKTELSLARPHTAGGLSKKFKYNQRRQLRLLEEEGMLVKPVTSMDNDSIAAVYIELFEKRWGFKPTGHERLRDFIEMMRPLLFGSFLEMDGKPIAFQMVYAVEGVEHISIEYINGGVDPAYKKFSPDSALSFLNTQQAWDLSGQCNKQLRYSFGKSDTEYKDRWCSRVATYSI